MVLVLVWEIKYSRRRPEQVTPKIGEIRLLRSVQEWWEENSMILILRAGQEMLGMSTLRKPPGDKETWWWNDDVNDAIRAKGLCKVKKIPKIQK